MIENIKNNKIKPFVRKKTKNGKHYIDNKKLQEEMELYIDLYNNSPENSKPKIPRYIAECIIKISEKLSHSPSFVGYSFRDEMVGDAIEDCLNCHKYNPNMISSFYKDKDVKVKAYSYFTQIVVRAFIRRIQEEEKNKYVMLKSYKNAENIFLDNDSRINIFTNLKNNETIDEFIDAYERKLKLKKQKTAENNKIKKEKGLVIYITEKIYNNTCNVLI